MHGEVIEINNSVVCRQTNYLINFWIQYSYQPHGTRALYKIGLYIHVYVKCAYYLVLLFCVFNTDVNDKLTIW